MKFNLEVDCTPEEARSFFGLPDVRPMQQAVMAQMERQMLDALGGANTEALLKAWFPMMPWAPQQMQDMMSQMIDASFGKSSKGGGS